MIVRLFLLSILVIIHCNLFAQSNRKIVFTDQAPAPIGPYSQAVHAGSTVYVSGQIALKTDGSMDTSSIENETHQVIKNIEAILKASNLELKNVLKVTIYVTDLKNFKAINEVYAKYFPIDPPARETVEVKGLPKGAHIEISVIAKGEKQ